MSDKTEKAEKAAKVEKSGKKAKKDKKPNIFVRMGTRIARFFREYRSEVKKVIWPTFPTVIKNSVVVLVIVIVIGAFIGAIDIGLSALLGIITV